MNTPDRQLSVPLTDREPNRWAVLALLSVAQLMVVLDATIVTIAIVILPGRAKPRVPSVKAALARLAIGNCHHSDAAEDVGARA
jgi:hypothetical protein